MDDLLQRIDDRSAKVGVVGLGHVGLPVAAAMIEGGFPLIGFDLDEDKVTRLRAGEGWPQSCHPAGGHLPQFTGDLARLGECDAVLVCVPTPLTAGRQPDLSHVESTSRAIAHTLRRGQLVVLESTTWPGTTRERVLPLLEATGLRCGLDFLLAYAPEREDPGRRQPTTRAIPRLVGGVDAASCHAAVRLYGAVLDRVIPVQSAEVAEAAKLFENVYRSVNIALVNEAKVLFAAMGIDVRAVLDAAATKPFGFERFEPGPGLGGHCIPIDPFYLAWKARQAGAEARLVELAGEINRSMPDWVVGRTAEALEQRGRALSEASILVIGVAYKPDVADVRESPGRALMDRFREEGASVDYHDPHVLVLPSRPGDASTEASVGLDEETVASYDCVVLATNHASLDYALLARSAHLIVDTRGAMRSMPGAPVVDA